MRASDLEKLRARLFDMRTQLIREVQQIEEALQEDVQAPGEISHVPTHNADFDVEGIDVEIALAKNEEGILEQVEAALERFEKGTYGRCENCNAEIPRQRLDAIPYTPHCINCAQEQEQSQAG